MAQKDKEQLLNDLWAQYHKVCEDCGAGNGCDDCRDCPSAVKKDEIRKEIEKLKTSYETRRQSDMEKIIEIPEGYEAIIEGNKVILEPKESEDEKIRKAIRSLVLSVESERLSILKITQSDCLVWLEKQGECNPNPYSGTSFVYNGHTWGMCARDNGVEILIDGHIKGRVFVDDTNAKEMFIKALERVEEQNAKGYKLTDCDKNSWWEDFKVYCCCILQDGYAYGT